MDGSGHNGPYLRLLAATGVSTLGDGVRAAAMPLLAASLTDRPVLVAGAAVAGSLPWLLCGLVAGAVIDRSDRRRLTATVDLARLVLLAGLVLAVALDAATIPLLYLVAFGCGVAETFRDTAAMVPPLVAPHRLDSANGRLANVRVVGDEMVGPPLGGYLFGLALALPFAVNAGLLAAAAALIVSLPHRFAPPAGRGGGTTTAPTGIWRGVAEGLRFVIGHHHLRVAVLLGAVLVLTDTAWFPVLVLYARRILELSGTGFGLLLSAGAVGGIMGAASAARLTARVGRAAVLTGSLVVAAAAQALLGLTSTVALAAAALAASSFVFGLWTVAAVTLRQRLAPPAMLGRVNASYRTVLIGVQPVGALLGGVVADLLGLRAPMLLGVPVLLVAAVLGHRVLRRDRVG